MADFKYTIDYTNEEIKIFDEDYKEIDTIDIHDQMLKLDQELIEITKSVVKDYHAAGKEFHIEQE